jgi:integrase
MGDLHMPKLTHALPKYRHHKASGQAFVALNGIVQYLGPYGSKASRLLYDRLLAEWLQQGRYSPSAGEPLTVVQLCGKYLRFAQGYYVKDGKPTIISSIKLSIRYLRVWYGRTPASEFGPLALKTLRQKMVEEQLSRRYVNDHIDRIRRIFKWAVAEQLVPATTYQALATVPGLKKGRCNARETEPVLPVADEIVDATLPYLPGVVADMVRLQRLTGMRPAEVCQIRPCDLDRSGDVWLYRPERHKTQHHGRERIVFIGSEGQAVLLRYLARNSEAHCFRPCDSETKRRAAAHEFRATPISCGNKPGSNRKRKPKRQPGAYYVTASYRRAITRACEKGKVESWAPNQLRHSYATKVRQQFGLEHAQVSLGHSNAAVTEIYAERDIRKGIEVARAIG